MGVKITLNKAKEKDKELPIDEVGTDADYRPLIRRLVPQGFGNFEGPPPDGASEIPDEASLGSGLWQSHFPRGRWTNLPKARKPQHEFKHVSKLCEDVFVFASTKHTQMYMYI